MRRRVAALLAVVSRRGSPVLAIAACHGARTITVTVTPNGRQRESCRRSEAGAPGSVPGAQSPHL
jgi:hypothetical protein